MNTSYPGHHEAKGLLDVICLLLVSGFTPSRLNGFSRSSWFRSVRQFGWDRGFGDINISHSTISSSFFSTSVSVFLWCVLLPKDGCCDLVV